MCIHTLPDLCAVLLLSQPGRSSQPGQSTLLGQSCDLQVGHGALANTPISAGTDTTIRVWEPVASRHPGSAYPLAIALCRLSLPSYIQSDQAALLLLPLFEPRSLPKSNLQRLQLVVLLTSSAAADI